MMVLATAISVLVAVLVLVVLLRKFGTRAAVWLLAWTRHVRDEAENSRTRELAITCCHECWTSYRHSQWQLLTLLGTYGKIEKRKCWKCGTTLRCDPSIVDQVCLHIREKDYRKIWGD